MSELKPGIHAADHHKGNLMAAITLVEYGDYQCPHCKKAHFLLKRLFEEKGEDILFVFRNFPLRKIHPHAFTAAAASEAAGRQDRFWAMHDLIFENQNKLTVNYFMKLAERIELDPERFATDSKDELIYDKIKTDFESGIRSGVNATPTFFLNGNRLLTYDETYDSLSEAIDKQLSNYANNK
jgi:protein-disulfide isomerase